MTALLVSSDLSVDSAQPRRTDTCDEVRLRALVEHPPAAPAIILGKLLSQCLGHAIGRAHAAMAACCVAESPPDLDAAALGELLAVLTENEARYELRARLASLELVGMLELDDPNVGLEHDPDRWCRMLHGYTRALDEGLHARLETLVTRRGVAAPTSVEQAWDELLDLRLLDACLGLLIARAAMLDPRPRPQVLGSVDEMATDAVGSFAWWCRWFLDAWDDDHPLGERLLEDEIDGYVTSARLSLGELDAGVLAALLRVFPAIGS